MSSSRSKSSKAIKSTSIIVRRGSDEFVLTIPFKMKSIECWSELKRLSNSFNDAVDVFIQIRNQMEAESEKGVFNHRFQFDMVQMRTICRSKTEEEEGSMVMLLGNFLSQHYNVVTIGFPFDESGTSISTEGKKINGDLLDIVVNHK